MIKQATFDDREFVGEKPICAKACKKELGVKTCSSRAAAASHHIYKQAISTPAIHHLLHKSTTNYIDMNSTAEWSRFLWRSPSCIMAILWLPYPHPCNPGIAALGKKRNYHSENHATNTKCYWDDKQRPQPSNTAQLLDASRLCSVALLSFRLEFNLLHFFVAASRFYYYNYLLLVSR